MVPVDNFMAFYTYLFLFTDNLRFYYTQAYNP
jgi:hypothetical protein